MSKNKKILIYGYGNPGRQDDGLGSALIDIAREWVKKENLRLVTLDDNFQLQVDDVTLMIDKDLVIFVDASREEKILDYHLSPVLADTQANYSMHAISPGFLLALYHKLYDDYPPVHLLQIRGYEWEMSETITPAACHNLEKAWTELRNIIRNPDLLTDDQIIFKQIKHP